MNKYKRMLSFVISFWLLTGLYSCNQSTSSNQVTEKEEANIKEAKQHPQPTTDSIFVTEYISQYPDFKKHSELMHLFYGDRDYKLGWFKQNQLVPEAAKFLEVVEKSTKEGLNPEKYKIVDLENMIARFHKLVDYDSTKNNLQKEIDVALTASYFNYASDFYRGKVMPTNNKNIDWYVKRNKIKLHKALQTILKERESTYPYYQFEALHTGYTKLRDALERYRLIEQKGGWPEIESVKNLEVGDSSKITPQLRKRLSFEYDLKENIKNPAVYDKALENAVKDFQERHGLEADGVVGPGTIKELNVSVSDRIDQIIINMERWRWIPKRMTPKRLDQEYIFVNIPEYKLYVYEYKKNEPDREILSMRVIVGKTMNSTPIFSDKIEYIVFSPYWNVPKSIIVNELKPGMLRNSNFLAGQNMEVLNGYGKNAQVVSASAINWSSINSTKDVKFQVRQRPGPRNALGTIKFIFPNEYSVYLHDTPTDHLFSQSERGFSHGCVRVEKPKDLANYLLKNQDNWTEERIEQAMNAGEEKYVNLNKKVQVYIVYFTSWVDDKGRVNFREDIYGHDEELEKAYFG